MKTAAYNGVLVNDKIWFSNIMANGLYTLNIYDGYLEYILSFDTYDIFHQYQHKQVLKYNNTLIFVPLISEYINFYEINEESQWHIRSNTDGDETISNAFIVDDILWMIPMRERDPIIKVSLRNYETTYDYTFSEWISEYNYGDEICIARCSINNCRIEFAIYGTSYYGSYNLVTQEKAIHDTGIKNLYMAYKKSNGNILFLQNDSSCIFEMNQKGEISMVQVDKADSSTDKRYYNGFFEYRDCVCAYPAFFNNFAIQSNNREWDELKIHFSCDEVINPMMPKFYGTVCHDNGVCFLPFYSRCAYFFDGNKILKVPVKENFSIEKIHINNISLLDENSILGLDTYIKSLCQE